MNTKNIKTVLIDDEQDALKILGKLLQDYNNIEVVATADNADKGIKAIIENRADLVFLDVEMPGKNGFDLLEELRDCDFLTTIIFVTAYNEYAIKAFEMAAFDYLLKPIDPERLRKCILRFINERNKIGLQKTIQVKHKGIELPLRVKFNTRTGFILVNPQHIMYCEADGNYTTIHLIEGKTEKITYQLGKVAEKLNQECFFRMGRSYLINNCYIEKIDRKKKFCILIDNGKSIEIPSSKECIMKLEKLFNTDS